MPKAKTTPTATAKKSKLTLDEKNAKRRATRVYPRKDDSLKRKFEILQTLKEQGIDRDGRKCIRRMGENEDGTMRYCGRWAIAGGTVCPKHGGSAPQVKKAAQARLTELLERKVERLNEISEQSDHMPSALGATQSIINRVMGKVGDAPKRENQGTTIQIGINLSGGGKPSISVAQLPAGSDPDVIDADVNDADDES